MNIKINRSALTHGFRSSILIYTNNFYHKDSVRTAGIFIHVRRCGGAIFMAQGENLEERQKTILTIKKGEWGERFVLSNRRRRSGK